MLTLLFTGILLSAQNIGIGNSNPAEKLDVNGNINVTGTIKANGTDGLPQQVLMKNSSGALTWGSICDYKNFSMFVLSGSFIIPAGVTKVAVEIWGGGGGGSAAGGGGAGGYAFGVFNVNAAGTANIVVGAGGAGSTGTGSASNGNQSNFTFNSSALGVNGGFGASTSFIGSGGSISTYSNDIMFDYRPGGSGKKNLESYQQSSSTEFVIVTKYGNGGVANLQVQTGGEGGYTIITTTSIPVKEIFGSQGFGIGEGGGGGRSYGYPGAAGRIIVYW